MHDSNDCSLYQNLQEKVRNRGSVPLFCKRKKKMKYSGKALKLFFIMVICLSAIAEGVIIAGGMEIFYLILMWIPAISAIVAGNIILKEKSDEEHKEKLHTLLGIKKSRLKYILAGILIPFVYLLIPYIIYWNMHPENFGYTGVAFGVVLKDLLPVTVIGIFAGIPSAIGEEIGWRGFMLPALRERFGDVKTLFVTGLIWAAWHLPLLAFGDYMEGAPAWFKLPAFVLCIVPVGIITGYLTYKSGSIWPAAFLHGAHNNFDQMVFDVITIGDDKKYFVSETGIFTIICAWVIAIVSMIFMMRGKLSADLQAT